MDLAGKNIWLTGASSGIGAALAPALAGAGARLILSARSENKLAAVKKICDQHGSECHVLPLDLSEVTTLPAKAVEAEELLGSLDMLMNNGGVGQRGFAEATELAVVRRIMDVNFFAAVQLTQAVLPKMLARGAGHIVVTSSILGKFAVKNRSAYCASKHALQGYFDALRAETAKRGIRVTLLCPGYVQTNISLTAHTPDGTPHAKMDTGQLGGITSEICAARIVKALQRDKREINIGGIETCGVNLKRFFPDFAAWLSSRMKVE